MVEETPETERAFTSSDDVVKSKHQTQATPPSGENLITDIYSYINYCYVCGLVEEVKDRVKGLKKRFRLIRRSMIECLDKCQIAMMTVVTLLSSVFGFDVRSAIRKSYHKDLNECKNNELFGYLNLYWNYLSFKPLSVLLEEPALKNDAFAIVRNEMCAYLEDIKVFRQNTTLVAFCSAVPYTEHDPPPGFQKMVTEHDWPETVTLIKLEQFQRSFLDTFSLPEHAMILDGLRRGSFKVTWFIILPATTLKILKGSMGKIKAFRDFNVVLVDIDSELIFQKSDSEKVYIYIYTCQ